MFAADAAGDFGGEGCQVQRLISQRSQIASAFEFRLDLLKFFQGNYGFMGILHKKLWQYTTVLLALLGDGIHDELLLKKHVPRVGYICQDYFDIRIHPLLSLPGELSIPV